MASWRPHEGKIFTKMKAITVMNKIVVTVGSWFEF